MTDAKPVPTPRKETDASRLLLSETPDHARTVEEIEIRPKGHGRVPLGSFTLSNPPEGFSIQVTPDHYSEAVTPQLIRSGATYNEYELVLYLVNFSEKTLSVEVFAA
ncbi:hypothetical protein [Streptomyces sp. GC420]|uniref:hypothetical protein n=1 Tax=Streptomyces sp. GC420 TaxID=2697568 RepID=UPI0014150A26|nr:hypothetical protein [Streptomyces sp. GC420]NBM14965.1 hypothetical protein [Streptomyces sp. GC420]